MFSAWVALVLLALLALPAPSARADGEDAEDEAPAKPPVDQAFQEGIASWYGPGFHGRLTANGEVYNQDGMTAAHRWLPFGTQILVTNLENGCSVALRVTDRGPFHGNRILDCSRAGAEALGFIDTGLACIRWDVLRWPIKRGRSLRLGFGPPIATSDKPLIARPRLHEPPPPVALDAH